MVQPVMIPCATERVDALTAGTPICWTWPKPTWPWSWPWPIGPPGQTLGPPVKMKQHTLYIYVLMFDMI